MLLTSLYFRLKPLIPRSVRLRIRRSLALRKLEHARDIWPIMPGSEQPPKNWPGWPNGKKFAFVLTHDVEGQRGLDRVKDLAKLEMQHGFRSCFNFIPEGPYSVPPALRSWLIDREFEVGVHDLHHDGQLFSSREEFDRKAPCINEVLKEWNAVGFRSAYMLRNLDWIHKLNISYDSSTFDTDPFEPQPDGVGTIFPFWIARRSEGDSINHQPSTINHPHPQPSTLNHPRSGYVELPYTLPQDSTLFLVLREKGNRIWEQKLDWIAQCGGMALLNVHPDFVAFGSRSDVSASYPAANYVEFLTWVKQNYAEDYWHVEPATIARFVRSLRARQETVTDDCQELARSHERKIGFLESVSAQ